MSVASGDSNWNTPAVRPARSMPICGLVVQRAAHRGRAAQPATRFDDVLHRIGEDGQRGEAEEVHLQHASLLQAVHVVLRDDHRFIVTRSRALRRLCTDRDVVVEGARRNHNAGCVHTSVSREPLERRGVVEQLVVALLVLVARLHIRHVLHRFLHGEGEVRCIRDEFRERVRFGRCEAEHTTDVLDGGTALHRSEGDDLSDAFLAILLSHVLDHFAATLETEVDVHIRHRDAFRIEESLEEQIECKRADIRDLEA